MIRVCVHACALSGLIATQAHLYELACVNIGNLIDCFANHVAALVVVLFLHGFWKKIRGVNHEVASCKHCGLFRYKQILGLL